ncbi:MAG: M48 family metallopeptidase [Candidatus Binatia bacterium]
MKRTKVKSNLARKDGPLFDGSHRSPAMEHVVAGLFLTFFFLELLVEFALNEMNMTFVRRRWSDKVIPDLFRGKTTAEDYNKSVEYTLAKARFQRWAELYGGLVTLFVLFGGVLPLLDRLSGDIGALLPRRVQANGIIFCLGTGLMLSALSIPTDLYFTFVIEERFGFNKSTLKLYLTDKMKGLFLGASFGIPFLLGVLWLIQIAGRYWWAWTFLFILGFQFLLAIAYPTFIAPLFNKFEPLKEDQLRERISALAKQTGLRTSGIYTMDGSRRSGHSNAYFTGIGKAKRIVLFDTLFKHLTTEQLLAVLAHEMGHYKMKHVRRMLALRAVFVLLGLYILSLLLKYEPMFWAFGLEKPTAHGALVLFAMMSGPFTFYLNPFLNHISRKHEYEADRFAARIINNGKAMEEALTQLTLKNLSSLTPHPWYSAYHYSHPSPAERIHAIRHELSAP